MRRWAWALSLIVLPACGYNRIQTLDEQVNGYAGQIKVQLQRRADLVPNLVQTVRGYAQQEVTIFTAVADARARLGGAVQSGSLQEMAAANQNLTGALGRLLAISENYPDLKSNENFRQLQDQLEGTENRIATARQDYNTSMQTYNTYIRQFPQVLTAKIIGKGAREYFDLTTAGAAEAPRVDFTQPAAPGAPAAPSAPTTKR
jgi:LemA protein